jgi:predicted flavoprotein YhiN
VAVNAAVIGGGPAGLMAAETLLAGGIGVDLYDTMPSVGRKFLLAGRGGLNITHAEAPEKFLTRYGAHARQLEKMLAGFGATQLRVWVHGLGVETFIGTSQRVFPREMKAAPLLRAWLHRLRAAGLRIHVRHRWLGWSEDGGLRFATPQGEQTVTSQGTLLAPGGGRVPTAPGCRCCKRAASRSRRCGRQTAVSKSPGAHISANVSPGSR